jgi:hypothetical protein
LGGWVWVEKRNFKTGVLYSKIILATEGSHSGLVRAPAKRLPWVTGVEGSNPSPSATNKTMSSQIDDYINKQASPQKEICQHLREIIFKTLPDVKEEMKWGVPAFADGKFYIVALKDHVNLGFSIKGLTKEDIALFDSGGKTMKHIEVDKLENIDEKRIVGLLKLVAEKHD